MAKKTPPVEYITRWANHVPSQKTSTHVCSRVRGLRLW